MNSQTIHQSNTSCKFVKSVDNVSENITVSKKQKKQSGVQLIQFDTPVYIIGKSSIVGQKEKQGPLGKYFDAVVEDDKCGQQNYEQAEIAMLKKAIFNATKNAKINIQDIGVLIAGDLLNQLNASNYAARELQVPFMGLYSACSTMTQSLIIGSVFASNGHLDNIVCAVSSHFASAERQFRYPLEYGAQKPPYSQWTVTAASAIVLSGNLSNFNDNTIKSNLVKITQGFIGRVVDMGINDMSNMGAAMAPAFVDTLLRYFAISKTATKDYDLIVSGDLGKLGSDIARKLLGEKGFILDKNYIDCGAIIFANEQNAYQGGSGPACSASVINNFIIKKMQDGEYKKVLYLATGALMSPQTVFQGETIPCISHLVLLEI